MIVAFDPREHLFDIVEAAETARTQIEPGRADGACFPRRLVNGFEPCPQDVVHDGLEALTALFHLAFQPSHHIIVDCQCRSHIMMLT